MHATVSHVSFPRKNHADRRFINDFNSFLRAGIPSRPLTLTTAGLAAA
jgi:hypothetical protein